MGPRYHVGTKPVDEVTIPMVRPGAYHQSPRPGTTREAVRSGLDQAQEQARSGGNASQAVENGTLRLAKKTPSCAKTSQRTMDNGPGRRTTVRGDGQRSGATDNGPGRRTTVRGDGQRSGATDNGPGRRTTVRGDGQRSGATDNGPGRRTTVRGDGQRSGTTDNGLGKYVATLQDGLRAAYRQAREGLQQAALHQRYDYDGKVQRREYQAGELVWVHDITLGPNRWTKLQFPWYGLVLITKVLDQGRVVIRRKQDKPLTIKHVDRLKAYRGRDVPAWMRDDGP